MMKRRLVFFVLIVSMMLSINSSVFAFSVDKDAAGNVTVVTAMEVGEKFISASPDLTEWEYASLLYKRTLYDLDESELAYYFVVSKGSAEIGHILVSATKDRGPILQYSKNLIDFNVNSNEKVYYLRGSNIVSAENATEINKINTSEKLFRLEYISGC